MLANRTQAGQLTEMGRIASIGRILGEGAAPLVDFVYPPRCPACGDAIGAQGGLCADCWSQLSIPDGNGCSSCQRPFAEISIEGSLCAPCLASPPIHDGIAAGTFYNDISRQLVLAFKHGGRISLAPMMAGLIAARLADISEDTLVVPVPLHRLRIWKRGYNQAALLAKELVRRGHGQLLVDGLERHRATPSLGGMGKLARAKALSGAIRVRKGAETRVRAREILLVDDVLTSGATTNNCVKALKKAGATRVTIACFARVRD